MKSKNVLLATSALMACLLLPACGGSRSYDAMTPPPATTPPTTTLGTAQVLTATQTSSETDDPLVVNEGAVVVANANDDISDPIVINP
jgi:hypothetical protein